MVGQEVKAAKVSSVSCPLRLHVSYIVGLTGRAIERQPSQINMDEHAHTLTDRMRFPFAGARVAYNIIILGTLYDINATIL